VNVRRVGPLLAVATLGLVIAMAALGPALYRVSPVTMDLSMANLGPTAAHLLGTDESGRDVLARLLAGARVSLTVGVMAMLLAVAVGTAIGTVAGVTGGWVDAVLMRLTDAALSVPALFVVILVLTFLGSSVLTLLVAIAATSWMATARVIRGEVRVLREQGYVEAARALGATRGTIMRRHLLPHLVPTVLVAATVGVPTAILTESALSFLGLGVQPPAASWGNMLSGAQTYLTSAPLLAVYPGVLILATVLAVSAVGETVGSAAASTATDSARSAAGWGRGD
jgi:peptide/nickel transport system permease protein